MASKVSEKRNPAILLILSALLVCVAIAGLFISRPSPVKGHLDIDENVRTLYIEKYDLHLGSIERYGCTYFFLPSYVTLNKIDQTHSGYKLLEPDGTLFEKPTGDVQDILVDTGGTGDPVPWKIAFLKSENLCTIFLNPGETDLFSLDKDRYESVSMQMISPDGKILLSSTKVNIKGRGNGTAGLSKKPYELKFDEKTSLYDMKASRKWELLANASEETKLYNKMAFDTSAKIGLEYSIESEWVDLYADGTYLGNYLLCREPDIGKSDLNIGNLEKLNEPEWDPEKRFETDGMKGYLYEGSVSPTAGGYLFQIIKKSYYETKDCGFSLKDRYYAIKSPDNASKEQVEYIRDLAAGVDRTLRTVSDGQLSVVDERSFAGRFLIEEFFYNLDGFINSYYFYKKNDDDRIYAGPVWDYDTCIGKGKRGYLDYTKSLFEQNLLEKSYGAPCEWDYLLYQNEGYRDLLVEEFRRDIPVFMRLIEKDIDSYHEKTKASVRMDSLVWDRDWHSGPYLLEDSYIRYTKFFLAKRLQWLCERWDIDEDISYDFSDGTVHEVTFLYPDGSASRICVEDGTLLSEEILPEYDRDIWDGWCYNGEYTNPFSPFIPVFEDMNLTLCPYEDQYDIEGE